MSIKANNSILRSTFFAQFIAFVISSLSQTIGSLVDGNIIGQFLGTDSNDPTKTEERRELSEPYPSVINKDADAQITNNGVVAEASVYVKSNGVLGDLTPGNNIDI